MSPTPPQWRPVVPILDRAPERFEFGLPDDELLPITRCACGVVYARWEMTISIYATDPTTMPCCGRRVYFSQDIAIHEVP